jgi:DNA-binding transcriptional ArsR family regulator
VNRPLRELEATGIESVRALAHPLRLEMLDLLRFDGPSTATLLAKRVHESTGATSYHLRQLARYGFVEDVRRDGGRERWWRYRERRVSVSVSEGDESGGREAVATLLSREAHALDRFLSERSRSGEWDEAAFFQSRAMRLTSRELNELRRGMEDLLAAFRSADAEDPPAEALPVRILAFAFPITLENP